MKIYGMMLTAAAIFFGGCASYEQLLTNIDKAESWKGKVEFAPAHAREGNGPCFVLYGKYPTPLVYKDFIPVEPDKTYVYKVNFRTLDPKIPASGYMGLELYDADKRIIGHCNVQVYKNTESEVVSARKGDKFMTVKMIQNYGSIRYSAVAFNVKKDYSDLPNFDISPQCFKMTPDKDGNLRLEFKAPLKKDYPAGTPVRFHSPWSPSMYYLASGWMPEGEGRECTAILRGIKDTAGTSAKQFWKGTKYVRPFVWFGNWNRRPQKGAKLLVDGWSFESTDAIIEK